MDMRKMAGWANVLAMVFGGMMASGVITPNPNTASLLAAIVAGLAGFGHAVSPPLPPSNST